jgi:HAD superfamily hydrolase (TIGR01490 family)
MTAPRLALFDLDHTLLDGDSDQLWCAFLIREGLLDGATFGPRNAQMERGYRAGTVSVADFCAFYVSTLAGRSAAEWQPWRERFLAEEIAPRIGRASRALVQRHLQAGELVVMTTATNRFITELTAAHLGIGHLLATEVEFADAGPTGRVLGEPNMREGKVHRLHEWLRARGWALAALHSSAYSDSINDRPLLEAVDAPVAVDPDPRLAQLASERGWPVISLREGGSAAPA